MVWRPRLVLANVVLAVAVFLLFCLDVGQGDYPISIGGVVQVLLGGGSDVEHFIVWDLRMPRSLVGVLVGVGLGISGAVTQSITRNPLASPDILGITAGASAGAVAVIIFGGSTMAGVGLGVSAAALLGGLLTAGLIYVLAWRRGIEGFRLVLIGIAVNAVLAALTSWMLVHGEIWDVQRATVWLNGSLAGRGWRHVWPAALAVGVVGAVALASTFALSALRLGEDTARALGVRVQLSQAVLLVASVVLAAMCVTAAGPIGFVAFVAPQLTVRLVGTAGPPLLASGLMGAALVVGSDYVARVVLPIDLPVGIVTTAIGGPFLMYLIIRTNRRTAR
ncbi:iron chelate uptake ABC transporter family permease subunit [Pimelobacter sp. 30-1]|uniref:FecCD family ABC transporter permease n=1 Tax=Pimelobacter sp. 30-1 TaxID=2004991 RepID=UPI001C040BE2|nr:iron chelate uptake ABC transporter family permease subunit [Pimelobacter sp. 30-1]MBU2694802.1 iron ABC transporter [Pimelobacter sp. 30-1]